MLRNGPSLSTQLWRAAMVACLAAGLALFAAGAVAEPELQHSHETAGRRSTVSPSAIPGCDSAPTASDQSGPADTHLIRLRIE